MKKLLSVLLAVVLLISAVPLGAFAFNVSAATSGYYTYTVEGDSTTVTKVDTSISGNITVPSVLGGHPVTAIGDEAFERCENITGVQLPDTIEYIGEYAFAGCENLADITIPYGVKEIGGYAFASCGSLRNIVIPDSVTYLGNGAFVECKFLDSIILSKNIKAIGDETFGQCLNLSRITIPDGVISIGWGAFGICSAPMVTIPTSVTNIDDEAFFETPFATIRGTKSSYAENYANAHNIPFIDSEEYFEFTEGYYTYIVENGEAVITEVNNTINGDVTIPKSLGGYTVTGIGDFAFVFCADITSIDIGKNITSIGDYAFAGCWNLQKITILKNVNSIGEEAFSACEVTIYGYDNSYAKEYAKENDIPFVKIEETPLFPDTSTNDWYYESVEYVVSAGIMSGYNNGKFGTSDSIQRQDFLVMLARLDGVNLDNYKYKSSFPDVARNSYYEAAVNWGAEKGIVTGYQNGKFGVGDKVTREQLVTFLHRYAKYKGYNYSYSSNRETVVSGQYNDYKNVSGFAKDPILWAIEKGVISGKTATTIAPQGNAQRCEVAKIMYNIYLNDIFK